MESSTPHWLLDRILRYSICCVFTELTELPKCPHNMAISFLRLREREAGGIGRGRKAGRKEIKGEEEGDRRRGGGRDRAQDENLML